MKSAPVARAGRFERLMFRRVPLWLLLLVMLGALAGLVAFGALVKLRMEGSKRYGPLSEIALAVASIPSTLRETVAGTDPRLAAGYPPMQGGFSRPAGSTFSDGGYALIARFSAERDRSIVELVRLRDGKVLREYAPDMAAINGASRIETAIFDIDRDRPPWRYRMMHPYLMPDGGLTFQGMSPLVRIDACGKVVWMLDGIFHHALERDADGHFWVGSMPARSRLPHVSEKFQEDGIAQISADGRVLRNESLVAILRRSGLAWLYEGRPYSDDPLHINDIEPVLEDGPYWRRGDLFLSLKYLSAVMLYRPSTGRIVWWRQADWSLQHDVSILDDHRISVFDNNAITGADGNFLREPSKIVVYDFATGRSGEPFRQAMHDQDIRSISEGRATPMSNGDFMIEESNGGRLVRMSPQGEVRWQYVAADKERRRLLLNWSRYLDPNVHGAAIRAAASARCA